MGCIILQIFSIQNETFWAYIRLNLYAHKYANFYHNFTSTFFKTWKLLLTFSFLTSFCQPLPFLDIFILCTKCYESFHELKFNITVRIFPYNLNETNKTNSRVILLWAFGPIVSGIRKAVAAEALSRSG